MVLTTVILLIILGVALMILEFFVVPGITVAGIGGFILLVSAVIVSYYNYESGIGHTVLIGVLIFVITAVSFALREQTWKGATLEKNLDFKVNTEIETDLKLGDQGVTVSRLAPGGKVLINDKYYEAYAENSLIDEGTTVEIIKINNMKVTVIKTKIKETES